MDQTLLSNGTTAVASGWQRDPKQCFWCTSQCVFCRYTFWSSDFHISPIADLKNMFEPMGMTVIDKSLSAHCKFMGTCAKDLKVRLWWM